MMEEDIDTEEMKEYKGKIGGQLPGTVKMEGQMADTIKAASWTMEEPWIMRPQGGGLPPDR